MTWQRRAMLILMGLGFETLFKLIEEGFLIDSLAPLGLRHTLGQKLQKKEGIPVALKASYVLDHHLGLPILSDDNRGSPSGNGVDQLRRMNLEVGHRLDVLRWLHSAKKSTLFSTYCKGSSCQDISALGRSESSVVHSSHDPVDHSQKMFLYKNLLFGEAAAL